MKSPVASPSGHIPITNVSGNRVRERGLDGRFGSPKTKPRKHGSRQPNSPSVQPRDTKPPHSQDSM
jgi:hypothetical protein